MRAGSPERADTAETVGGGGAAPAPVAGLVRLSREEVRRLLARLCWAAPPPPAFVLAWSVWRWRHQWRARRCHYKKRGAAVTA